MSERAIADELAANRARLFVGRSAELDAFDRVLEAGSVSRVCFFHGPGGIGKTTLLHALAARCGAAGFAVARCDARYAPADPALARSMLDASLSETCEGAGRRSDATLLMVDTFEAWAAIEGWFRDEYLPALPSGTRVVVAGRRAPGLRWRADPGWYGLLEHRELSPLSAEECREYLRQRAVSSAALDWAADASRGLPLLLALIADAHHAAACAPAAAGRIENERLDELLVELAEHLVLAETRPEEREALYLSALLLHTSEPLLAEVLHVDARRAAALFHWLRDLSFVETAPDGLFPHDAMRAALRTSLERRDPALRLKLLDAAVAYYLDRMGDGRSLDPDLLTANFHLFTSFMPRVFAESLMVDEPSYAEPARAEQVAALRAMVGRNAGADELALFDFWWREQPTAFRAVRGAEGELSGVLVFLRISEPPAAWLEADDLLALVWSRRERLAREWREGADVAVFVRLWTHRTRHMGPSPVGVLWSIEMARLTMEIPDVALGAAVHPDTEDWLANSALYGHDELEGSRRQVGDQRVVVTFHDFSEESTADWFRHTYRRFRGGVPLPEADVGIEPAVLRAALRNLHRPDSLARNPLLARMSGPDRARRFREIVEAECESLRASPRSEVLARVIDRTYLRPAADQRSAAEACQLTWDQYRRRLTEVIKLLAVQLPRSIR